MKLDELNVDWKSAGAGAGVGALVVGVISAIIFKRRKKKNEVDQGPSLDQGKLALFEEMGVFKGSIPIADQDTFMMQFSSISAFLRTECCEETAIGISTALFQAILSYNRSRNCFGPEVEVDATNYINGLEDDLIALINSEDGSSEEIRHSAADAVLWIMGYLRSNFSKYLEKTGTSN